MKSIIKLHNAQLSYYVVRSNRTTVSLRLHNNGELEVRTPKQVKNNQIEEIIQSKLPWIEKQYNRLLEVQEQKSIISYEDGAKISIYGKEYGICVIKNEAEQKDSIWLQDDNLMVRIKYCNEDTIQDAIILWCKKAGKPIFENRAFYYAQRLGVSYERITIKGQKSCWGSCSNKSNLNFDWKLLLMPEEVLDYGVVHELAHLIEMNHSSRFWEIVSKEMPNYKEIRKWLKENGYRYG